MIMANITQEMKELIEKNIIAFATVNRDKQPHTIAIAYPKVVSDNQVILTDNFMQESVKNIKENKNVSFVVWNTGWKDINDCYGYEFIGNADYFDSGKWLDFVKNLDKNKGLPAKGAVLITISNIKKLV